jgi:serine phosphatase RsbU (regulator of sigma subunit)/uncharacterized pyridoxamine 5'-phosphate oxidase family protein
MFCLHFSVSHSQDFDFEQLNSKLDSCSADSAFYWVDQSIDQLKTQPGVQQDLHQLLVLKIQLADSLSNRVMKELAYAELVNITSRDSLKSYYRTLKSYGNAQYSTGNIDGAMLTYFQAADFADSLDQDSLKADIYRIIGTKYKNQRQADLAVKYLNEAIVISQRLNDSTGIMNGYMTLGNAYKLKREEDSVYNDTALFYYEKSLAIAQSIQDDRGIAGNYNNIGNIYRYLNETDRSLEYYFKALEINLASGNKAWTSFNYNNIGAAYERKKNRQAAIQYYQKSIAIKEELKDSESMISTLENLAQIYAKLGDFKSAYNSLNRANRLSAEVDNAAKKQIAQELEAKFQNEKKAAEINALRAEQSLQKVVIDSQQKDLDHQETLRKKEQNLIYALGFILLSLIVTVIVFWRNSQQRKRYTQELQSKNEKIESANQEIERAKRNLEQKNQEVTDSINYAKRIQAAILPSEKMLNAHLQNAFVFYLPKDIVAGDFYWTERVGKTLLFAVADCTGHGVPGAMVSVICHNALNNVIQINGTTDPGQILDETTAIVLEQFAKSDDHVRDGMDIALCSFNTETRELKYAGAHTPLWLVRNGEIFKYSATRRPVGEHSENLRFESHEIPIQKGDFIYLSSDGFTDQFGGEKGKKFLNKRFRNLLIELSYLSIPEQRSMIESRFFEWKAHFEQVDDVCVLGVQVDE